MKKKEKHKIFCLFCAQLHFESFHSYQGGKGNTKAVYQSFERIFFHVFGQSDNIFLCNLKQIYKMQQQFWYKKYLQCII